jgi:hypothetical protein
LQQQEEVGKKRTTEEGNPTVRGSNMNDVEGISLYLHTMFLFVSATGKTEERQAKEKQTVNGCLAFPNLVDFGVFII